MTLKQALMNSQDLSEQEAEELISEMKDRVQEGENPEEVLRDEGLEPDYFFELL
jgi:hypothetical protein